MAITCTILNMWDYRAFLVILAGTMIHSGCDILNDIFDFEIDKICKPNGAIASGQISMKKAWGYMLILFSASLLISITLSLILFLCLLTGIIIGGVLYSHPIFRFKDIPCIAMLNMAVCFALESIGLWSVYSLLTPDSLMVAAYVFALIFSLTFMKDFKDVAGDINSLPLMIGIRPAASVCSLLTILPLIPLLYAITKYHFLSLVALIYVVLIAGCIQILLDDPVAKGNKLKDRMIMALTIPNFMVLLAKMIATPSGLKPATRIHQVPSGSDIRTNENITNIYYNGTCIISVVNEDHADGLEKIGEVPDFEGWLKSTVDRDVAGVQRFVAYWNVPTAPPHPNNDAVDFLFNAIEPNGESGIMQPVLEWNQLQSGRWTGAAWYGINDVYYHSVRINVDQGDKIEGLLSWDNTYNRCLIALEDVTTGHQVYFHTNVFGNTHLDVYTTLEGKHVVDNGDVPGDTMFYDMEFKDLNLNTFNVIWGEVNYGGIPVGITNLDANIISSSKVELLTAN